VYKNVIEIVRQACLQLLFTCNEVIFCPLSLILL